MTNTFTAKLGKDGTRIWLEGARLIASGFKHGSFVQREWGKGKLTLTTVTEAVFNKQDRTNRGKVSGRADRPVIDITGEQVRETFASDYVDVAYAKGSIVITKAK